MEELKPELIKILFFISRHCLTQRSSHGRPQQPKKHEQHKPTFRSKNQRIIASELNREWEHLFRTFLTWFRPWWWQTLGTRLPLNFFFFLNSWGALFEAVKNCKAGCVSSRLAGYWEKFSISNNRASDEKLWKKFIQNKLKYMIKSAKHVGLAPHIHTYIHTYFIATP